MCVNRTDGPDHQPQMVQYPEPGVVRWMSPFTSTPKMVVPLVPYATAMRDTVPGATLVQLVIVDALMIPPRFCGLSVKALSQRRVCAPASQICDSLATAFCHAKPLSTQARYAPGLPVSAC